MDVARPPPLPEQRCGGHAEHYTSGCSPCTGKEGTETAPGGAAGGLQLEGQDRAQQNTAVGPTPAPQCRKTGRAGMNTWHPGAPRQVRRAATRSTGVGIEQQFLFTQQNGQRNRAQRQTTGPTQTLAHTPHSLTGRTKGKLLSRRLPRPSRSAFLPHTVSGKIYSGLITLRSKIMPCTRSRPTLRLLPRLVGESECVGGVGPQHPVAPCPLAAPLGRPRGRKDLPRLLGRALRAALDPDVIRRNRLPVLVPALCGGQGRAVAAAAAVAAARERQEG